MNKQSRAHGYIEGFSRKNWRKNLSDTWIMHHEGRQMQIDRVVIIPFDEAVKLGIVQQDKQQEPSHD